MRKLTDDNQAATGGERILAVAGDDGEVYPVFCTISIKPDRSPKCNAYASLRQDHQIAFVADADSPFAPTSKTAVIRDGGAIEFDGRVVSLAAVLSDALSDDEDDDDDDDDDD